MPKKSPKKPIKAEWKYVPAPDTEQRLQAAFALIWAAPDEDLTQAAETEREGTSPEESC